MITEDQYKQAAALIGCEVRTIKAVTKVEAPGGGFLPDGKVRILFEPHIFHRELLAKGVKPVISGICYPKWGEVAYGRMSEQHGRLEEAMKIDAEAALKSASWGLFQIMGNNYKSAGYFSVFDMVDDYKIGEANQLMSFVKFIKNAGISKYLVRREWANFAERYNGKGYKKNKYDQKLSAAYLSAS